MQLEHALRSKLFLKAASLILGFLLWVILADSFVSHIRVTVPLAFYNKAQKQIDAPETVTLELRGKRTLLRKLHKDSLAVHIDAQNLKPGPHFIAINHEHLFLPPTIAVSDVTPLNLTITIKEEQQ